GVGESTAHKWCGELGSAQATGRPAAGPRAAGASAGPPHKQRFEWSSGSYGPFFYYLVPVLLLPVLQYLPARPAVLTLLEYFTGFLTIGGGSWPVGGAGGGFDAGNWSAR